MSGWLKRARSRDLVAETIDAILILIFSIAVVGTPLFLAAKFFGWLGFVVTGVLLAWYERKKIFAWCPHGVAWGTTRNRCETCVREQEEITSREAQRLEAEWQERERQHRINSEAETLQERERLRLARSLILSIEELRQLSPQQFEDAIARMFERMGFSVKQTPYWKDHGRDAILMKNGKKFLLECKRHGEGKPTGRPDLQRFHSALMTDGAERGFFVTTGRFTREASEFSEAIGIPIELIDQSKLKRMMFESIPAAPNDDSYSSMCRQCGTIVAHCLRSPRSERCRNGHEVAPTLNIESALSMPSAPSRATRRRRPFGAYRRNVPQSARVAIIGNTYPIRHQLKALGGRWSPDQKAWMVPADSAEEAKALAAGSRKNSLQK